VRLAAGRRVGVNQFAFGSFIEFFMKDFKVIPGISCFACLNRGQKLFDRFLDIGLDVQIMQSALLVFTELFNSVSSLRQWKLLEKNG